ncbi:hypothetical protein MMC28_002937 [Mycoblastus sanguinarius]|nr:hypothetical protein [Mycoblastus sanguinarius]
MLDSFTAQDISVAPNLPIHTLSAGTGPPLLLIHGFPQNRLIWHRIAPHLISHYTAVIIDLRGYGKSAKPAGGNNSSDYSKTAMASDCAAVMTHLGFEKFYVCGHDRGGRVAHKLCVNYPERVLKAIFLDICPTLAMYEKTDFNFAKAYWHWFFLIQQAPLPESLILGNPRGYIENVMNRGYGALGIFDPQCLESYIEDSSDKDTVHGMCEDYRAAAGIDLEEQRSDIKEGRKIVCPLRVLWGKYGVVEAQFDALNEWKKVSEGEVDGEVVDSGHFIPEAVPDVLLKHINEFFTK